MEDYDAFKIPLGRRRRVNMAATGGGGGCRVVGDTAVGSDGDLAGRRTPRRDTRDDDVEDPQVTGQARRGRTFQACSRVA